MSPYFSVYFVSTYFDTASTSSGRGPKSIRRVIHPQAPVPQDHEDDLVMVRLL